MQLIYIILILNSVLKISVGFDFKNGSEKIVKKTGRLSRVTWLMHENENKDLDHRMFEDDDGKTREKINNKMHYIKRKYNVKVEHNRRDTIFQNTSKKNATVSRRKEIAVPKYSFVHISEKPKRPASKEKLNEVKIKASKNNLNRTIKFNTELRTGPNIANKKEKGSFHNRNYIETDGILKDIRKYVKDNKKAAAKENIMVLKNKVSAPRRFAKQEKELHRKSNTVYLNNNNKNKVEGPKILMKEVPEIQPHPKIVPNKNTRRNSSLTEEKRENILNHRGIDLASLSNPPKQMHVKTAKVHDDDNTYIADELAKKVRVLCWVMTHPANHNRTCKPIKETWGRRCNKLLFMSTEYDPEIPTVKLNVLEGRDYLWPKVKAAFKYVYDKYYDQYDWFVRADDDTFLVVENLRYLLAGFDPQEPMYFGCRFKHFSPQGFMSGGASIPLSKAALGRFVAAFSGDSDICKIVEPHKDYMFGGSGIVVSRGALETASKAFRSKKCEKSLDDELDDAELGVCLSRIGVKAMDSRDVAHKGRFLVFMPQDHVSPTKLASAKSFWYWKYVYYPTEIGAGCCSDYAISFHYVKPDDMYALDYLIYRIRPFGIQPGSAPIPEILGKTPYKKKHTNRRIKPVKRVTTTTVTNPTTVTITKSTTYTPLYDDMSSNTQYSEGEVDVTTAELYERAESPVPEFVTSKTIHSEFYEQNDDVTDVVPTDIRGLKGEYAGRRFNVKSAQIHILSTDSDNSTENCTTIGSKSDYEDIVTR